MPEFPDVELYIDALRRYVGGKTLLGIRLKSPFLLRSVDPPLSRVAGRRVEDVRRMGKRIVLCLGDELFLVLHLMIAGRLRWRPPAAPLGGKWGLAAFDFREGALILTEAGSKKRASLHLVQGEAALAEHDPGGLEILEADAAEFTRRLLSTNHTLKRALTDPRLFSGIGNAYSDEILHAARLSPFRRTSQLSQKEISRLYQACCKVLLTWRDRLLAETGDKFPEKVTAFRPRMAVHGRYKKACPVCGSPVQRIIYAQNEANYCATCQTGGKVLADRVLSRLLGDDWPRTLEELELRRSGGKR